MRTATSVCTVAVGRRTAVGDLIGTGVRVGVAVPVGVAFSVAEAMAAAIVLVGGSGVGVGLEVVAFSSATAVAVTASGSGVSDCHGCHNNRATMTSTTMVPAIRGVRRLPLVVICPVFGLVSVREMNNCPVLIGRHSHTPDCDVWPPAPTISNAPSSAPTSSSAES